MSTLSTWYHSQYATWNRTRRLQAAPFLVRTDTNTSRAATAMATRTQGPVPVVVDTGDKEKEKKKQDALFGPNIGVVSSGPAWTDNREKKVVADELTPDVVKSWIARSKESTQPTTTLQALVNLKRPTLRLSPLAPTDDLAHADSHDHHGLEFEYDCDAPKCGIYVHVLLSPEHPQAEPTTSRSRILVFESVVDGGFGKILKLEEGATLELGRFEHNPHNVPTAPPSHTPTPPTTSDSPAQPAQPEAEDTTTTNNNNNGANPTGQPDRRRRFTNFHFRKRTQNRSVSGPALAVVDAEVPSAKGKDAAKDVEEGVKVTIRLAALDEQSTELASPNEQVTYLHVVKFGAAPSDGEEDSRPWVVKVVKREATIGPHTFHLHEIFGLSSAPSHPAAPTAPSPVESDPHSYPPMTTATEPIRHITEDEPSSECLVCLSSPREVVLLPCRHLVACKECALNMVEFGAGGTIVHSEAELPAPPRDVEASATGTSSGASPSPPDGAAAGTETSPPDAGTTPSPPVAAAATRRKRKAKGWFCPVCRQPYTSLLRITTSQPVKEHTDRPATPPAQEAAHPLQISVPSPSTPIAAGPSSALRVLGSALRPGFLRSMSRSTDLEQGSENTA